MVLTFKKIFFDHPAEIGEGYFEHQKNAFRISIKLEIIINCNNTRDISMFIH